MSADIQQAVLIQRPVFKMNPAADFWQQARGPPPISPSDTAANNNNNNNSTNNNNTMTTPPLQQQQPPPPPQQQQHPQQQQQQQQHQHQHQQQQQQQPQQPQPPPPPQQPQQQPQPDVQQNSAPNNGATPGPISMAMNAGETKQEPPQDGMMSPGGGTSNALVLADSKMMMTEKIVNELQVNVLH